MHKRVLLGALAAAALLVVPVASTAAKQDGDGGKKCEKTKSVGFKVRGTFDGYVAPNLTITPEHWNRHAGDWLEEPNDPTFDTTGAKIKFVGLTDNPSIILGAGTIGFEDAVTTDRVKVKAKLEELKHGCEDAAEVTASPDPVVKKVKVKRADTETDETETDQID